MTIKTICIKCGLVRGFQAERQEEKVQQAEKKKKEKKKKKPLLVQRFRE